MERTVHLRSSRPLNGRVFSSNINHWSPSTPYLWGRGNWEVILFRLRIQNTKGTQRNVLIRDQCTSPSTKVLHGKWSTVGKGHGARMRRWLWGTLKVFSDREVRNKVRSTDPFGFVTSVVNRVPFIFRHSLTTHYHSLYNEGRPIHRVCREMNGDSILTDFLVRVVWSIWEVKRHGTV